MQWHGQLRTGNGTPNEREREEREKREREMGYTVNNAIRIHNNQPPPQVSLAHTINNVVNGVML